MLIRLMYKITGKKNCFKQLKLSCGWTLKAIFACIC